MIDRYFMVYSNEDGIIYADKDIDGDYILYEDYIAEKVVDTETASEPITNALYNMGFSTERCDQIVEEILQYINDYGFIISKKK